MSSDARVMFLLDGSLSLSHDGECAYHPCVMTKYELQIALLTLEFCMGRQLAWEIRDSDEGPWLAGYCAR